jgi:ABC-type lipoprotein export system ATPase subunit
MIRTSNLTYAYRSQPEITFPDIHCEGGEHALILGPSGSGKTTLLHLLGGLLSPVTGEIFVNETPLHTLRGPKLDKFRGSHIGIIFQKPHFIKSISAVENLLLSQSLSGRKEDKARIMDLLERLSIAHKSKSNTYSLSIGEQQRLGIARALVNKPELVLADEPSSALDDENCFNMITLLRDVAKENNANLIIVTHDNRLKELIEKRIELQPRLQLSTAINKS